MQLKGANNSYPNVTEHLIKPHEILLQPGTYSVIWIKSQIYTEHKVTGILQPLQHLEANEELIICPSMVSSKHHHYMVQIHNFQDHPHTPETETHVVNISTLNLEQRKYIQPIDPAPIRHLLDNNHEDALQ